MARNLLICLLLAAATLLVYAQVRRFDYVQFDDHEFVQKNSYVTAGLTFAGVRWAWSSPLVGNWHPVTNLSHMVDGQLFALHAGGHHVTNVLLHVVNTLLLFAVLYLMTLSRWPSALVAALFALHPLHVESVAWISERKDVLSTFFGLLILWTYVVYARRGNVAWLWLTTLLLAIGLMAKPMLVTLPCLLLLLDYWPLERLGLQRRTGTQANIRPKRQTSPVDLLIEKIPLLCIVVASCFLTIIMQKSSGTTMAIAQVTMPQRIVNAVVAYAAYLWKFVWPVDLAMLYVHPQARGASPWQPWQIVAAIAVLAAITVLAACARQRRYLTVGWLWYLGVLVPVIGIVQVGYQSMADRYTYLPLVGVFIMIAWGGTEAVGALKRRFAAAGPVATVLALAVLAALGLRCYVQVGYWKNSFTLFNRTLQLEPNAYVIRTSLGWAHQLRNEPGDMNRAVKLYKQARAINPDFHQAHYSLAAAYYQQKRPQDAIPSARRAAELTHHQDPIILDTLAAVYASAGRFEDAVATANEALNLATSQNAHDLAEEIRQHLKHYQQNKAYD